MYGASILHLASEVLANVFDCLITRFRDFLTILNDLFRTTHVTCGLIWLAITETIKWHT
jgi:hypothetical protein